MSAHTLALEIYYSGSWHNIAASDDVYTSTTVGTSRYGAMQTIPFNPGATQAALKNTDGKYNPINAMSPLYGLLVRNMPMRITVDGLVRWTGEAAEWKPTRDLANIRRLNLTGGGIMRRLGIGTPPVLAALVATILATTPLVYWPLDDGPEATMGGSVLPGQAGIPAVGTLTFGAVDGPVGAPGPFVELASTATPGGPALTTTLDVDTGTSWAIETLWRGLDAGTGATPIILDWRTDSSVEPTWFIQAVSWTGTYELRLVSSSAFNITVSDANVFDGQWHQIRATASVSGGSVTAKLYLDGQLIGSDTQTTTNGRIRTVTIYQIGIASCSTASVGSIAIWDDPDQASTWEAVGGYDGELAADRFVRVAAERDVTATVVGTAATDSKPMGPQPPGKLLDTLYECVVTDGGIAYEAAGGGLTLHCLGALYGQTPVLVIDTDTDIVPPLAAVIGDRPLRNDVTAKRANGASARYELATGTMGTQDPPDGAGRYPTQLDVNPQYDTALVNYAAWLVRVGTTEAVQYPVVTLDLDANTGLDISDLEIGKVIQLDAVPVYDDPDTPLLLVVGMEESAGPRRRTVSLLTVPYRPFAEVMQRVEAMNGRRQAVDSVLASGVNTTALSLSVSSAMGVLWDTAAGSYPSVATIDGEDVTVTAVSGASSPQTFTVTRSTNGVVKSHSAGASVLVRGAGVRPL